MSALQKYLMPILGVISSTTIAIVAIIVSGDLAKLALVGSFVILGFSVCSWAYAESFEDDKTKDAADTQRSS